MQLLSSSLRSSVSRQSVNPPLKRACPCQRPAQSFKRQLTYAQESRLPRIAQPSIWRSIIPRALRERRKPLEVPKNKKSNPATYFIWIYILIGSQSIRIMQLKEDWQKHKRMADQKLAKLREVVQRLQNGEQVDVEKLLETDDPKAEEEWEQALRELESEERLWQNNRRSRKEEKEKLKKEEALLAKEEEDADPVDSAIQPSDGREPPKAPSFY